MHGPLGGVQRMRSVMLLLLLEFTLGVAAYPQVPSATGTLTIGVLDGTPALTFGEIADITADASGRIYILDRHAREIRVFSPDGEALQIVGRRGGGPGEYQEPSSVTVLADNRLMVTDRALRRITMYAIEDSLTYQSDIRIDLGIREACRIGTNLFLLGFADDALVHQITLDRDGVHPVRSFGGRFADHPMQRTYGEFIACIPRAGLVVVATGRLPLVQAYRVSDGALAWKTTLEDYTGIAITPTSGGGLMYSFPDDQSWYHWVTGVFPTADGQVAVQVGTVYQEDESSEARDFAVRILSPAGLEVGTITSTFQVYDVVGGRLYGARALPFPQVIVDREGHR